MPDSYIICSIPYTFITFLLLPRRASSPPVGISARRKAAAPSEVWGVTPLWARHHVGRSFLGSLPTHKRGPYRPGGQGPSHPPPHVAYSQKGIRTFAFLGPRRPGDALRSQLYLHLEAGTTHREITSHAEVPTGARASGAFISAPSPEALASVRVRWLLASAAVGRHLDTFSIGPARKNVPVAAVFP